MREQVIEEKARQVNLCQRLEVVRWSHARLLDEGRREFIRKKLAIGKIKARYRGYLVRKSHEALGGGLLSPGRKLLPSGLAPQNAPDSVLVTQAMQYKMQILEPHHKVSYVSEGAGEFQVTPRAPPGQEAAVPRVDYFHLFETIALLPYEDEAIVLETSSEKEIARIFASRLVVERKGCGSDYHFFITRPNKQEQDGAATAI
ncbi:hypothetical protein PHYPSEUDO_012682, partial [Phytophthora pseudosyringae]